MTTILDLLEEYMIMRKYSYERLDGQSRLDAREKSISRYLLLVKIKNISYIFIILLNDINVIVLYIVD